MASCLRAPAFSSFCPSAPSPCHVTTSKSTHRPLPLRAQVATIATTNEASPATRTSLPRRFSHLSSLACDLASASDISAALQPWLDKLTPDEWNALVLDSGSRDWNNAWRLFSAYKERTIESSKHAFDDASESNKEYLRVCTSLLRVLCKFGRHEEIRLLQQHMERACIKPDDAFSNTLLEWYASKGLLANASELLIEMEKADIRLDPSIYEKVAFAYLRDESSGLSRPKEIMEELIKKGAPVSEGLFKNLIKGFWRLNDLDGAEEVFAAMKIAGHAPDLKVLLKLMELHSRRGNYKKVLELIKVRSKSGWRPTSMAYDYLLQAFCRAGLPKKAERALLKYESVAGKPSIISYNMLIDSHVKLGQHEEALQILSTIYKSGLKPSAVSYSSIIPALVKAGRYDKAEDLFMEMVEENIQPNLITYQIMIQCFTKRKLTGDGHEMYISMRRSHDVMTNEAYGVVLTLYLEGNWYNYAAITLMEIEKSGKSLTAASQNSLIRSFGTLGNIPNSLTKAVQESQFEVCKLLTSLFISNPKVSNLAPEHVDMVIAFLKSCNKSDDKKSMAHIFNAFMDVFWKKNLKTVARQVLHVARKAYAGYTYPQFQDAEWILDVRGLSVGGAKIALVDWLVALREKIKTGVAQDLEVIIVTGDDMVLDVVQDQRLVKTALMSMLDSVESPFVVAGEDPGKLQASRVDVVRWISQGSTKEALKLGNVH